MISYPKEFPVDAAQIVLLVAKDGLQEDGQHGDLACLIQANWNLVGFGLGVWKPHEHELRKNKRFNLPATRDRQIKKLSELLAPVTPDEAELQTTVKAIDWEQLPWEQIVMLAIAIINAFLKKPK